jgi:hypothetical protein
MTPSFDPLQDRLNGLELRLKRFERLTYLFAGIVVLIAATGFQTPNQKQRFTEIDVVRLNIIEPDGRLALVIANTPRLPDPIIEGREVETGRTGPGMLFFNADGDESGGLTFKTAARGDDYQASGHLSFDQYKNDQVVYLSYQDNGRRRSSGLYVVDRPARPTIGEVLEQREAARDASAEERRRMESELLEATGGRPLAAQRVFVGSDDGTAIVRLRDVQGRNRIRIFVDAENIARMEFLDETGQVIYSIPR